jgi:amino acid adenylation domain-containing protein
MPDPLSSRVMPISVEPTAGTSRFACFSREEVEQSIQARFERQARLSPGQIAVADAESTFSYRDLNGLANRIARAILAVRGTGPEPVALLVGSGVPVVAAMLGVLKAGKFYVVLDASQPLARTAVILAECRPALLIADSMRMEQAEALCTALNPEDVPLLNLDTLDSDLSEENPGLATITGSSLAYILYTSGSTGKPKGVMQDHRYVLHLAMVYTNSGRISAEDRLALLYSPSFAGAVRDIYCALFNGATLLCFDVKREGLTGLADWLRNKQITVFFAVATMFRHFCRLLTPEDQFPSVRLIELGSETVYAGDVHLYQRHFSGDCRMIVNLGGSEISPICQFLVGADTQIEESTVPAGYAAEDIELLLWDNEKKEVEAGAPGEIVVRSRYLSRGYWGHPELTKTAFLPDPEGGDRHLFRTGDLGRMLPDGCLLHLGRRDFQVKIRGYRVETAEVEAFFTATGLVRDAAVTAWPDSTGEQNLAAWLVPVCPDAPPSINELRTLVAAALPDYMTPASFVLMDSLPLTESGKLDRRALPDPREAGLRQDTAYVAPRTAVEQRLKEIWSELLGRERIGIQENFFDLGGNSLLALQVVARIAAAFRLMLPPNCLFEYSTLARLAEAVEHARSIEADEAIRPASPGADTPLSFAQQRLWLFSEIEGPSETFNIVRAFRLDGFLDLAALEKTFAAIGSRHDNLRVSFRFFGNGPVQVIAPLYTSVLSFVDLQHVPENQSKAALDASLHLANSKRFYLANGPLWSVQVIRLAGNHHVLHLAIHHIIGDDWSVQVLLRELSTIYNAYLTGVEDPFPKLPVQYADYAAWQRRWLAKERLTKQLDYWRNHLRGAPPLVELPLDRPRRAGGEFHAGMVRLHLDRELTTRLQRLSRESETTLFVSLLAAYAILLSRYGNPGDVVIGTALANRYPVETEALIGFFVSTLALRLQWREGAAFREVQACAHRAAVNGYAHPDIPFDRIVEVLQPDRSSLHNPIFQTLFVLQNVPKQELVLPGLVTTIVDLARPSAGNTFDLTLSLKEIGGELCGAMEFNTALFDTVTIERMAEHFKTLLTGIVQDPDSTAGRLPLAIAGEQRRLLESASHTPDTPRL